MPTLREKFLVFYFEKNDNHHTRVATVYATTPEEARTLVAAEAKLKAYAVTEDGQPGANFLVMTPDEVIALGVKTALMQGDRAQCVGPEA